MSGGERGGAMSGGERGGAMSGGELVLLLAPSRSLGGGIERYVSTVAAAFDRAGVRYRRLDLLHPGCRAGTGRRIGFVREVLAAVRAEPGPVRLVLAHRNLLPVLWFAGRRGNLTGAAVILHGSEVWAGARARGARLLRRPEVRAVAASNFTAGAVARLCRATVLPPGVPEAWHDTLVAAGERVRAGAVDPAAAGQLRLVTAFRLTSWRDKGLPTLLAAVESLADDRVRLTVCGSGPVPADLAATVAAYPWCRLAPDLPDRDLAGELARADLFVLGTRLRAGAAACGEGFGLVLLEAQLAGTPVVAPAHGGSGDAFLRDITGVAPVDESPAALAAVLARLLADDRRRAELGRAAAAWARTCFAPDRYARQVVEALLADPPAVSMPSQRPAAQSLLDDGEAPRRGAGERAVSG